MQIIIGLIIIIIFADLWLGGENIKNLANHAKQSIKDLKDGAIK